MAELVPKLVTSDFSPIWGEVNISQALAASKQQELFHIYLDFLYE